MTEAPDTDCLTDGDLWLDAESGIVHALIDGEWTPAETDRADGVKASVIRCDARLAIRLIRQGAWS